MQKKYRLTSSRSFDYIYRNGVCYRNNILVLFCQKSKYPALLKVGFSVGKKVGGSVIRNRTKRRLKEAFRSEIGNIATGYNYLIAARSGSADYTYAELKAALMALLAEAGSLIGG